MFAHSFYSSNQSMYVLSRQSCHSSSWMEGSLSICTTYIYTEHMPTPGPFFPFFGAPFLFPPMSSLPSLSCAIRWVITATP